MTITPQDYFMIATSLIEKKKLLLSRDINPIVIELIHDIDSLLEKIETSDSKLQGLNTMIHQLYQEVNLFKDSQALAEGLAGRQSHTQKGQ